MEKLKYVKFYFKMSRFFKRFLSREGEKINIPIVNPYTNGIIHEIPFQSFDERLKALDTSQDNFIKFKKLDISERISMLEAVLSTIHNERKLFAEMITESIGKPIHESEDELKSMMYHSKDYINMFQEEMRLSSKKTVSCYS